VARMTHPGDAPQSARRGCRVAELDDAPASKSTRALGNPTRHVAAYLLPRSKESRRDHHPRRSCRALAHWGDWAQRAAQCHLQASMHTQTWNGGGGDGGSDGGGNGGSETDDEGQQINARARVRAGQQAHLIAIGLHCRQPRRAASSRPFSSRTASSTRMLQYLQAQWPTKAS
jgi:hypothetical protein